MSSFRNKILKAFRLNKSSGSEDLISICQNRNPARTLRVWGGEHFLSFSYSPILNLLPNEVRVSASVRRIVIGPRFGKEKPLEIFVRQDILPRFAPRISDTSASDLLRAAKSLT
jgi:hypothetical protein